MSAFTSEEQSLLSSYVTNTDQSVFALTNLPEVIKGALFSRYSRSTLGLRELLLKDFIRDNESEFQNIQGVFQKTSQKKSQKKSAQEQILAVGRAQKFYDRILDGYGDDSIGELGGAHLALEQISILATKIVEDARIGGSPLEKSTRYVSFSKKIDGDYAYYKPKNLLNSKHSETYLSINRLLFDTYVEFMEPIRAHVRKLMPQDQSTSKAAYERSVRAKAYDLIRGILPASTLTCMGMFGNGRFFETLISKLHLEPLGELQDLGASSFQELSKVIPSFVRRSHKEHRHFNSFKNYNLAGKELFSEQAYSLTKDLNPNPASSVQLLDYDTDAENKVIAALLYSHTQLPLAQLKERVKQLSESEKCNLIEQDVALRQNRRHSPNRALEIPFYSFDLLGDYGMYRDLHRHRMLTQERQALSTRFGYKIPSELEDAGLGNKYHEVMQRAAESFETIACDFPEEAQYVVPMSYNIRWYVHINLRALTWMLELRTTPQGHENYRKMAQEMYLEVKKVQPLLAHYLKFVDLEQYALGRLDAEKKKG